MDKMTAGLLGAVAGLATIGTAQASIPTTPAPTQSTQAASYADLLEPIPNAVELLKADNAARAQDVFASGSLQLADWDGYGPRYHHHHHHNYGERYGYYRRNEHHHHHHHHHNNSWVGVPGVGGVVIHHGD